jgi:hypothetical protein
LTGWMSGWFLSGKMWICLSVLDFMVFPGCIGRRLYRAIVVVSCCTHTLVLDSMLEERREVIRPMGRAACAWRPLGLAVYHLINCTRSEGLVNYLIWVI